MTAREKEVAMYCLDRIETALEVGATTAAQNAGRVALALLGPMLDGSHGAASHATRGRPRKAQAVEVTT